MIKFFDESEKVYERSNNYKRANIIDNICDTYFLIEDYSENDEYKHELDRVIHTKIIRDNSKLDSVNLLTAYYKINVSFDLNAARKNINNILNHSSSIDYTAKVIDILLDVYNDEESALKYLHMNKDRLSRSVYFTGLYDIYTHKGEYDTALEHLKKAHEYGLGSSRYSILLTFCHLKAENYYEVVECCDWWLEKINDLSSKDILIVNREQAKKCLNQKIDQSSLNMVVSHRNGNNILMCANILLGKETQARAIFKKAIEHCRMDLYQFNKWPIIPRDYFEPYKSIFHGKELIDNTITTLNDNHKIPA